MDIKSLYIRQDPLDQKWKVVETRIVRTFESEKAAIGWLDWLKDGDQGGYIKGPWLAKLGETQ